MRRVIALAGAAVLAATVTGCDGSKAKTPPNVEYVNFVAAFQRLHRAGFRVTVPYFPAFGRDERAEQGRGRLSNYVVVRERRFTADTVALTLTLPPGGGPIGSIAVRKGEPAFLSAPDLVGQTYPAVTKRAGDNTVSGFWLRVSTVDPLDPQASADGLGAFRVASQMPRPGTRLLFGGGVVRHRGGISIRPAASTITVALETGGETTAAEAGRRAGAALHAAAKTGADLGPFPRTATVRACRIPEGGPVPRYVYGECFTGVDLSGKNAVVVYRQLWDGRDFRGGGAPARPDLEHVWEVTVSPAGRVLSVRSFGAPPPQLVA
jgi:hypothetical protein